MPTVENHKEMVPFEHYTALYAKLDPMEAAERCGVRYDQVTQSFAMRLPGRLLKPACTTAEFLPVVSPATSLPRSSTWKTAMT